ncbi:hypothetical protein DFH09DRAFT_1375316 [Mycena vulgaris]|nr:hypothetical protein DFH09DRAFT_1375316 [Mycena vulgaris]
MKILALSALFAALALAPMPAATAPTDDLLARQIVHPWQIIFYVDPNYQGASYFTTGTEFAVCVRLPLQFNDIFSSFKLGSSPEFPYACTFYNDWPCGHPTEQGEALLTGSSEPDLNRYGLDNKVSAFKCG